MKSNPGFAHSRRLLLKAIPPLLAAPVIWAQSTPAPIPIRKLHSFALRVTDVARSVDFYQALFGSPVQARQGDTVLLRIGNGPDFYSLSPVAAGEAPGISAIGISVPGFDIDSVQAQLAAHGVTPGAPPSAARPDIAMASRSWVRSRGAQAGGTGTRELFFTDQDALVYQLSDPAYCRGSGPLGNVCEAVQASPSPGSMQLVQLSHFTNRVHNSAASNQFHRSLFGLDFQAYQGPSSPVIGVGDGIQFLMYIGGAGEGRPPRAGVIDHVCLSVADFDVDRIIALLEGHGITPRQDPAVTPPLVHYISMRMPNRGGAEGGTPELYFSDPDGIRIQLQDPGYCGGTGYLGNDCSAGV